MFSVFTLDLSQFEMEYKAARRQHTTTVLGLAERLIDLFILNHLYEIFCFHQPNMLFDFWKNTLFLNPSSPIWHHLDFSYGDGRGLALAFASSASMLGVQK